MQEINAYRTGRVCLSVCMTVFLSVCIAELKNYNIDLDDVSYG
jgi:hypothetical protein